MCYDLHRFIVDQLPIECKGAQAMPRIFILFLSFCVLCAVPPVKALSSPSFLHKHVFSKLPGARAKATNKALAQFAAAMEWKAVVREIDALRTKIIGTKENPQKGEVSQSRLWAYASPALLLTITKSKEAVLEAEKEQKSLFKKFAAELTATIDKGLD
jgi:hypothetical protein